VVGLGDGVLRPDHRVGPLPQAFNADAPDDALARCEAHSRTPAFRLDDAIWHQRVIEHARTNGLTEAVCLFAPAGDWAAALNGLEASFNEASIDLIRVQRDWDTALWPGARRGFFPLRKHAHHGGLLERLAQAGDLPK
jgi:hypothetical protein